MESRSMNRAGRITAASAISAARSASRILPQSTLPIGENTRFIALKRPPWLAGSIKQNRHRRRNAEGDFDCFGIINREVGGGKMHTKKSRQHAPNVAQGLPRTAFPDHQAQRHHSVDHQSPEKNNNQSLLEEWDCGLITEECPQRPNQLPVTAAQAANQNERQQQSEPQGCAQQ